MSKCLWCSEEVVHTLSIKELVLFSSNSKALCSACSSQLKRIEGKRCCKGCSRLKQTEGLCQDCIMWKRKYPDLDINHRAVYLYNTFAKELIAQFKFQGDCELADVFAKDIIKLTKCQKQSAVFIPVPVSRQSMMERGFNQTELLLESANIPYQKVLNSSFLHEKQSKKKKAERLGSPQPFTVNTEMGKNIKGKKVIIVDDIYTTGRTVYHAAQALLEYNPASIGSISLFR